jgi:hypothetical protein
LILQATIFKGNSGNKKAPGKGGHFLLSHDLPRKPNFVSAQAFTIFLIRCIRLFLAVTFSVVCDTKMVSFAKYPGWFSVKESVFSTNDTCYSISKILITHVL